MQFTKLLIFILNVKMTLLVKQINNKLCNKYILIQTLYPVLKLDQERGCFAANYS